MPAFTYLGDGSSNPSNVPAADITAEQWDAFDDEQKESVLRHSESSSKPEGVLDAHVLYEEVPPEPPPEGRKG